MALSPKFFAHPPFQENPELDRKIGSKGERPMTKDDGPENDEIPAKPFPHLAGCPQSFCPIPGLRERFVDRKIEDRKMGTNDE